MVPKQTIWIVLESVWSKGHDAITSWKTKEDVIIPFDSGRMKNIHSMTQCNERYYDYLILYAVRSKNINTVKILIDAGADLNVYGEYEHNNPLMVAVENNDANMVKLLLSSGIDVNEELENKRENIRKSEDKTP